MRRHSAQLLLSTRIAACSPESSGAPLFPSPAVPGISGPTLIRGRSALSSLTRAVNEIVCLRGALGALRRTTQIAKNPSQTICDALRDLAVRYGDRVALVSDRESLSYRELDGRANRYARWARRKGIGKGDVVALMMSNRPEYMAIWIGLARVGAATALLNTNQTGAALAHSVKVVGARWAIVEDSLWEAFASGSDLLLASIDISVHGEHGAAESVDRALLDLSDSELTATERAAVTINDPCVFVYTSGTTGLPKAANINHYRVLLAMLGFAGAMGTRASDRIYVCLPMYHTNGGVLAPGSALMVGGTCVIRERFSARDFWSDIVRHRCTMFVYIGELCRYLLNTPPSPAEAQHRLRMCFGNGLRPDVWMAFRQRFRLPRIVEFYAATEGNCSMFNFDGTVGAVGRIPKWAERRFPMKVVRFDVAAEAPVRDAEGRCIECAFGEAGETIGQILSDPKRPGNRFEGYADKTATERKILRDVFEPGDAWFRTGDLMRKDALGYYYFVDRIGDTFRWKGENVATSEVAEALTSFPGVREANVYGVAVPGLEGRAGMVSLVADDPTRFDFRAFFAHASSRLADYARPVFLRFADQLDATATFKQRKLGLVAQGCDPTVIDDPIFLADPAAGTYVPLDRDLYGRIASGSLRL